MNTHTRNPDAAPDRQAAETALETLRRWAASASPEEIAALDPGLALGHNAAPEAPTGPSREYPADFVPDAAYRASMPDMQNGPESLIRGDRRPIQHVGISNFRLPLRYRRPDGADMVLETSVTGTVGLDADRKGINMSRIMRSFYDHAEETFSFGTVEAALDDYQRELDSLEARIQLSLSYPMRVDSLRSGLSGYQYYDITLEVVASGGERRRVLHLDYVYASTCPCSLELSEHARRVRGQLATPHSQRSVARLSMVMADDDDGPLWFEDIVGLARRAVPTETQVMVKREDEQAFAELNAANPVFVEDAVRLFAEALLSEPRVGDFRIAASHQESLHSHDAVSVVTEGEAFAADSLDPCLFSSLKG